MKIYRVVVLILLSIPFFSQSQNQTQVDSLLLELKNYNASKEASDFTELSLKDTTEANILYQLSKAYMSVDPDKAFAYAKESYIISEAIHFKKGCGKALNMMGAINSEKGNYSEALDLYRQTLKIRIELNDKKGIASAYNNIGVIYDDLGNYPEALKNYFASLKIQEEIGDKSGAASSYNNIGIIYDSQGNYKEALRHHLIALQTRKELNDPADIADSYTNIAVVYKEQSNFSEALKNQMAALEIYKATGNQNGLRTAYNNIAAIYGKQSLDPATDAQMKARLVEEALKNSFSSLKIAEELGDKSGITNCYINMGSFYLYQEKYALASDYLNKALKLSYETGNLYQIKYSFESLSELHSKLAIVSGNTANAVKALDYYKSYINYRDSLENNEFARKITQQQMQYDFDKKEVAANLKFAQEKEIETLKLQKQKAYTYGGLLGISITVILLFFVYRNYNREQIANKKLQEALDQLIKSEKMAAFGVMATRVSHEIQNPLNFVNNFSDVSREMLEEVLKSPNETEKKENAELLISNLKKINEHGKRAAAIVKQLQEHSRNGTAQEFFESRKQ